MAYPILASNFSWYKSSQARSTITQINIVDSDTPTGNEPESWNADTGNTGSIKCYRIGTVVTIAGNGSGKISVNASSIGFFANSTNVRFTSLKHITGANLLDTSNVTTVNSMFYGCTSLISVDVSNWNLSNLTSMKTMFYECKALTELDVSKWNLSKVTSMQGAFRECNSLTNLPAGNWDVSNVTDMSYMFYECNSLST